MNKDAKAMKYAIEPIRKILQSEAISDGGTQKKAEELGGTWIRLNEYEYALYEDEGDKITRVYNDDTNTGCACDRFKDSDALLCEHQLAFRDLKSPPQLTIENPDYRWLRGYLSGHKWYAENRYLYPPTDPATDEPEVVKELPPVGEELDPVNEDKPLDTGVADEPEPKMIERKCHYCGFAERDEDRDIVVANIAEHQKTCPKNPANKKKLVKYTHPDGTECESAEALLDHVEGIKEDEALEETITLMAIEDSKESEEWTTGQLEVMRKTVAANATPEEFAYFLNVAKYSGLNPFLREIYFVKNEKGQTTIITGRDGYLTIAKRDPRFRGIHSMEVCEKDEFEMSFEDGMMKVSKHKITNIADRGKILGAWACGRMDGQDTVTIFASMTEYDKSGNARGGKIWKQYTSSMIRKVVESMVLKRIAGISGLVTEAEVGATDFIQIEGDD